MLMRRFFLPAGAAALLLVSVIGLAQERRPAASDVSAFADQRAPIALSDDESACVRREMRGLLESVRDMLEASSAGDRAGIAAAARRAGLNGPEAEHIPKSLDPSCRQNFASSHSPPTGASIRLRLMSSSPSPPNGCKNSWSN